MVGDKFDAGQAFGVVESVKAASDLLMPIAGEVTEVNRCRAGTKKPALRGL